MLVATALSLLCLVPTAQPLANQPVPPAKPATVTAPAGSPEVWMGSISMPGGVELEFTASLNGSTGTIDIPMQGAKGLELADVLSDAKIVRFVLKPPGAPENAWAHFEAAVAEDGKSASGLLKQAGMELPLKMKHASAGEKPAELKRPQEPKPPYPYAEREVSYTNRIDGTKLAGTLTVPGGSGPHPVALMITGSGAQNRNEELLGHKPFLVMADYLTRHGIAVLRVDDRGVGGSTGDMSKATSADFVGDVLAGVEFLSTQPDIDPRKIGLIGHSEGGLIAPMVAARSERVAFVVLLAGTGVPGREVLRAQSELIDVAMGMTPEEAKVETADQDAMLALVLSGADEATVLTKMREVGERQLAAADASTDPKRREEAKTQRATLDATIKQQYKQLSSPWLVYFLTLDPRESLRKTHCPVLALNGEKDLQVPPKQNLPEIEKALKEAGNKDVTIKELPGLNHLFQHCTTGSPAEYAKIEETCSPEVLEIMTSWIRERSGLPAERVTLDAK